MSDANDLIMGASVQGAKFETIGDLCQGEIVKIGDKQQSRKFRQDGKLGELAFWDDGSPIWQVRIDVQTDVRDPAIQHDDGIRALHVRAGSEMRRAIQEAVRAAGARELLVGAFIGVQLVGTEQSGPVPAPNDKKLYQSVYRPPNPGSQMLMASQPAQQAPPAQWNGQAPYVAQQAAQPQWAAPQSTPQAAMSQQPQPVQQWAAQPVAQDLQQLQQPAQAQLQQAQAQHGIPQPNPTMQHANGQPGMQQPANPASDPKVQALLAQVNQGQ